MPLRIFRSRPVAAANAIQILSVAGMFGMFFLGALYLRRVLGYDALEIGLAFLPVTIAMGTLSIRYSERIFMALGARRALLAGLTLVLAGLAVFALAPVHADYATQVAPSMLLLGLGAGTAFPALMNLAMSGATPQDAGLASGLVNTTAQVGGALGLAVLATLSTSRSNALIASGHPDRLFADQRATTSRSGWLPRSSAARSWSCVRRSNRTARAPACTPRRARNRRGARAIGMRARRRKARARKPRCRNHAHEHYCRAPPASLSGMPGPTLSADRPAFVCTGEPSCGCRDVGPRGPGVARRASRDPRIRRRTAALGAGRRLLRSRPPESPARLEGCARGSP